MSQELLYTSAPRGLKPGSRGFSTVASTQGMAPNLADQLESLSGYRHVFPPQDPRANQNPVVWSHLRLTVGGRALHVLSRIADAGLDYTQRTNKFAHHVVLDASELVPAGPAWLLAAPGFMETAWAGEPRLLPSGRRPPTGSSPAAVCRAWQEVAGDAGWGGALAETALPGSQRQAVVVYRPGTDVLPLVVEALALLPPELRWQVTFSTYYTKLPAGMDCKWRFVVEGTPEAAAARQPQSLLINLCAPLAQASGGPLVEAARTGAMPDLTPVARQVTSLPAGSAPDDELLRALLEERAGTGPAKRRAGSATTPPPLSVPIAPPELFEALQPVPSVPHQHRSRWRSVLATAAAVLVGVGIGAGGVLCFWPRERHIAHANSENNEGNGQRSSTTASVPQHEPQKESGESLSSAPSAPMMPKPVVKPDDTNTGDKEQQQTNMPATIATEGGGGRGMGASGTDPEKLPKPDPKTPPVAEIDPSWKQIPKTFELPKWDQKRDPVPLFEVGKVRGVELKLLTGGETILGKGNNLKCSNTGESKWKLQLSVPRKPGEWSDYAEIVHSPSGMLTFTWQRKNSEFTEMHMDCVLEVSRPSPYEPKYVVLREPTIIEPLHASLDTPAEHELKGVPKCTDCLRLAVTPKSDTFKVECHEVTNKPNIKTVKFSKGPNEFTFRVQLVASSNKPVVKLEYLGAKLDGLDAMLKLCKELQIPIAGLGDKEEGVPVTPSNLKLLQKGMIDHANKLSPKIAATQGNDHLSYEKLLAEKDKVDKMCLTFPKLFDLCSEITNKNARVPFEVGIEVDRHRVVLVRAVDKQ